TARARRDEGRGDRGRARDRRVQAAAGARSHGRGGPRAVVTRRRALVVGIALAALTIVAYSGVARNDFTTFDDPEYVTQNPHVAGGLSMSGLEWAFTGVASSNWHPVTWISHMLDCEVFGLHAAGHLLVGLAIHVATTLLLLRLLL